MNVTTKTLQTLYLPPRQAVIALSKQPLNSKISKRPNAHRLFLFEGLMGNGAWLTEKAAAKLYGNSETWGDTLDLGECPNHCYYETTTDARWCGYEGTERCRDCDDGRLKRTVKAVKLVQVKSIFAEHRGTPYGRIMDDLHKNAETSEDYVILADLEPSLREIGVENK